MNVVIHIHYLSIDSESKSLRRGIFPLKGRKAETVAFEFWQWVIKEHPFEIELEKVIVDGEDITEKVKKLEKDKLMGE